MHPRDCANKAACAEANCYLSSIRGSAMALTLAPTTPRQCIPSRSAQCDFCFEENKEAALAMFRRPLNAARPAAGTLTTAGRSRSLQARDPAAQ
jgi:hypothetical protein